MNAAPGARRPISLRFEHHLQRARLAAVEKAIGFGPFRQFHAVTDLPLGMQATGADERDEFRHVTLDRADARAEGDRDVA